MTSFKSHLLKFTVRSLLLLAAWVLLSACSGADAPQEGSETRHTLNKPASPQDSLRMMKSVIAEEKRLIDSQIGTLLGDRQSFIAEQFAYRKARNMEKQRLTEQRFNEIQAVADSVRGALRSLVAERSLLGLQLNYVAGSEGEAGGQLAEGVKSIVARLDAIERRRAELQRLLLMDEKESRITEPRLSALDQELNLLQIQKDQLMRQTASREQIEVVLQKILSVQQEKQSQIAAHEQLLIRMDTQRMQLEKAEAQAEALSAEIQRKYDEKKIIENFLSLETARISHQVDSLSAAGEHLAHQLTVLAGDSMVYAAQRTTLRAGMDSLAAWRENESAALVRFQEQLRGNTAGRSPSPGWFAGSRMAQSPAAEELFDSAVTGPAAIAEPESTAAGAASSSPRERLLILVLAGAGLLLFLWVAYLMGRRARTVSEPQVNSPVGAP